MSDFIDLYFGCVRDQADYALDVARALWPHREHLGIKMHFIGFESHTPDDSESGGDAKTTNYSFSWVVNERNLADGWNAQAADPFDYEVAKALAGKMLHANGAEADMAVKTLADSKKFVEWQNDMGNDSANYRPRFGILIDKSGVAIHQVNKFNWIRAVAPSSVKQARHARESVNANALVMSAMYQSDVRRIAEIAGAFLATDFIPNERRIQQIRAVLDAGYAAHR